MASPQGVFAPVTPEKIPETLKELDAWIETHFERVVGPPRAYFEIPIKPPGFIHRERYEVLGVVTHEPREAAESKLVHAMYLALRDSIETLKRDFDLVDGDRPILFERRALEINIWRESGSPQLTGIRYRLSIPGVDLRKSPLFIPEGALFQRLPRLPDAEF